MIYNTYLTNFGYSVYEGPVLSLAKAAAVKAGFECVIYKDGEPILTYSPIQGWRGTVNS